MFFRQPKTAPVPDPRYSFETAFAEVAFYRLLFRAGTSAALGPLTVELSSFNFTPAKLTMQQGRSYRLHLSNTSSGGHNFVAKEFFAASNVVPEDRGKVVGGKVDVSGGQSVEIRLVPNTIGSYKLRCSHFMHSAFGMTGVIVVQ